MQVNYIGFQSKFIIPSNYLSFLILPFSHPDYISEFSLNIGDERERNINEILSILLSQ